MDGRVDDQQRWPEHALTTCHQSVEARCVIGVKELIEQAEQEIAADERRAEIDRIKAVLIERRTRPLWQRLFPYTITITRN
jgi:UTP:GlnB (protein PII) uridylyltransferase